MNALCNLSREVAASLPGRFLSRRCFTLCITVEVEPRIAKQYKCHHCCSCKITVERGWRVEKSVFASFFGRSEDREFVEKKEERKKKKKSFLGHPVARATSYCLLPDTF